MKSHEQDLLALCRCIIYDAAAKCATDNYSIVRDLNTIETRTKNEGLSFLTITLPSFGQDFERALDSARVTSDVFVGWRRRLCLPAFLQGFTRLVFDAGTGGILDEPDIAAIEGIRQIAYTFKKLQLPCTPKREQEALSGYLEVEQDLRRPVLPRNIDLFNQVSDILWGDLLHGEINPHEFIPKHGPGQTAEGITGNRKYQQRNWFERLEPFFPSDSFIMCSYEQFDDENEGYSSIGLTRVEEELPVKITLVPKTLKGPRIIAMEPVCMQYAQQAVSGFLVKRLESGRFTRGHLNFRDQKVNQALALSASADRSLATLDLSAASDRVKASLVSSMLRSVPLLRDAIFACRSRVAQMPNGDLILLRKFASMGSALCFPIESMFFFSVIISARLLKHKLPVTSRNIYKMSRDVYIYGDDIIIPVDEVDVVIETLTDFFCKVNSTKSFWNGKFRESCGYDAYSGDIVTPTYLRNIRPYDKRNVSEILSWIATSNLFYLKGYWKTADSLKTAVESILGSLPIILGTSPGVGWLSYQDGYSIGRQSKKLHRPEVLTYVASPVYRNDPLDGWAALLKCELSAINRKPDDIVDKDHLKRSLRSGTSALKRRWVPPF